MSGSDSAGVNAMVPGRKCEPRTQLKPILFGFEPLGHASFLHFLGWTHVKVWTSSDLSWVSSFFFVKIDFFTLKPFWKGKTTPTPVRFVRCIVGVMRVRDFSTATEVVMGRGTEGMRLAPSLYKWNLFFFSFGDPTCHSISCLCSIVGRSRPGSRWRFCNPK